MNEESQGKTKNSDFLRKFLKKREQKRSEFFIAIIVNIIIFYIVNNLLLWDISFIAPSFADILWILNISIVANIIANIIFLILYKDWLKSLIQVFLNILGILVIYYLYVVFPFIFSNMWVTWGVIIALILAFFALIVATFVEAARFILVYIIRVDS